MGQTKIDETMNFGSRRVPPPTALTPQPRSPPNRAHPTSVPPVGPRRAEAWKSIRPLKNTRNSSSGQLLGMFLGSYLSPK